MSRVALFAILILFSLIACTPSQEQGEKIDEPTFTWVDPAFNVAYPGPYAEGDSALSWKALRFVAGLAEGKVLDHELPLGDSLKLSLDNQPIYVLKPEEFKAHFSAWHQQYDQVEYEAFNVRPIRNIEFETEVFFCFGRWRYHSKGTIDDRYSTMLIALGPDGKINAITEWTMCWPKNSSLVFTPNADPRHFHYFSPNHVGSMESAVRAVVEVQALYRGDTQMAKMYLADSLNFTSSCGNNEWLSKREVASYFDNSDPFFGIDPISVIPFYQPKQGDAIVLVLDYESFLEDGAIRRFSYLRTFIFDEALKVKNILVQRRAVPNSVNWNWQRQH